MASMQKIRKNNLYNAIIRIYMKIQFVSKWMKEVVKLKILVLRQL